ncbi:GGDEF domain-containing protein [Ectothiorhodospiraceae bacterium WFHF3C12]|nr:GGDEF domain-containing protein [Ectothiorhodospiraceae bacterium WFHF3C12]
MRKIWVRTEAGSRVFRERRQMGDRRAPAPRPPTRSATVPLRVPTVTEQAIQFLTRYLFCGLGLAFFNVAFPESPRLLPVEFINAAFALYLIANTGFFLHAWQHPESLSRYRVAMWLDIVMVSMCLVADPNEVPPSAIVYIMVVLGNGMRYGLRLFGEAVVGSFAGAMLAVSLRFAPSAEFHPGLLFVNLFGGIILVYAYILMSRVEASRRALEQKSQVDALTGIVNRRGLEFMAQRLFAEAERTGRGFTVMFADMDNFKQVNDRYGHAEGDRVLRQLAHILQSSIRESDVAGRHGGDEFVIILPHTRPGHAEDVARRIQDKVRHWARDNALDCSISVGIGEAPALGGDLETVLRRVDEAMYAVKREGGGVQVVPRLGDTLGVPAPAR